MYYYFKGALVYFWLVLLLFQEATYSDLVISRVLCVLETSTFFKSIELIDHSSCSHSFDELPYFYYEESVTVAHSFKITVFFRTGVVARRSHSYNYDTSLVTGIYIVKDSLLCYLAASIAAILFFYDTAIILREHLKRSITSRVLCLFHNICCSHLWLQAVWMIQENLKGTVLIWGKQLRPGFKLSVYSTELIAVIFVWKKLKYRKGLKPFHFFIVNVLIWQFHSSNFSYPLSVVNFLETPLDTFALTRVAFRTAVFAKELLFRSSYF